MLIQQILDEDIINCHHAFEEDKQLKDLEEKLYAIMDNCPEEIIFDMEQTVNAYGARLTRIAYLQGLKDFAELFVILKDDAHEILQNIGNSKVGIQQEGTI